MNKDLDIIDTFELAFENQEKNNFVEAENLYNDVLEIDPNHLESLMNLGIIKVKLGQYQIAKSCYEKIIKKSGLSKKELFYM